MLDIGPGEVVTLCVVGLILLGPDRLPELARSAAHTVRAIRDLTRDARSQIRNEVGPEIADLRLSDLNPRRALRNALLGEPDEFSDLQPSTLVGDVVEAVSTSDEPQVPASPALEKPPRTDPPSPEPRA